ncbi:regulatory protein RecX [Mariniluteicoccus flavus]
MAENAPEADPEEVARQIVLRQLTMQARTRHELAETLRRKGVPGEAAERVLDRMDEVGLVDDARFAASWVESRQQRRHLSRRALRQELGRKGVDRDVIDEAMAEVGSDDEREAALALAEKKLRSMGGLDPVVQRRRLAGALARKGFGPSTTSSVLAEVMATDPSDEAFG